MPWTLDRYPPAMRRLTPEIRSKAIEIANAMLEEGRDEGQAIRMAIAAARKWAWSPCARIPAARGATEAPSIRGARFANTRGGDR
jgi:hypothetical protein